MSNLEYSNIKDNFKEIIQHNDYSMYKGYNIITDLSLIGMCNHRSKPAQEDVDLCLQVLEIALKQNKEDTIDLVLYTDLVLNKEIGRLLKNYMDKKTYFKNYGVVFGLKSAIIFCEFDDDLGEALTTYCIASGSFKTFMIELGIVDCEMAKKPVSESLQKIIENGSKIRDYSFPYLWKKGGTILRMREIFNIFLKYAPFNEECIGLMREDGTLKQYYIYWLLNLDYYQAYKKSFKPEDIEYSLKVEHFKYICYTPISIEDVYTYFSLKSDEINFNKLNLFNLFFTKDVSKKMLKACKNLTSYFTQSEIKEAVEFGLNASNFKADRWEISNKVIDHSGKDFVNENFKKFINDDELWVGFVINYGVYSVLNAIEKDEKINDLDFKVSELQRLSSQLSVCNDENFLSSYQLKCFSNPESLKYKKFKVSTVLKLLRHKINCVKHINLFEIKP